MNRWLAKAVVINEGNQSKAEWGHRKESKRELRVLPGREGDRLQVRTSGPKILNRELRVNFRLT